MTTQRSEIVQREREYWEAHGEYKWMDDESIARVVKLVPHLKGSVLELCSGSGMFTRELPRTYDSYTCLDLSENLLKGLKKILPHIQTVQGDAQNPDFPDESFDTILIFAGLHHLPDLDTTLKNVYRLLKPGGVFFCYEPNNDCWYRRPMLWMRDILKLYTEDERFLSPKDVSEIMRRSGLVDLKLEFITPGYDENHLKLPLQKILGKTVQTTSSFSKHPSFQTFFTLTGKKQREGLS